MLARFFKTTDVDEYSDWVLAEIKRTLPPGFDPTLRNLAEKVERLEKRIAEKTGTLLQTTKLSIYQKARLAARVREGMTEHGYPAPFVKSFSLHLIDRIQKGNGAKR